MTGEMSFVDPNEYPHHFAAAERVGGEVEPFDKYQGPVIVHQGRRYFLASEDGQVGEFYCRDTDRYSGAFLCGTDTEVVARIFAEMVETGGYDLPFDKRNEQAEAAERQAVDIG